MNSKVTITGNTYRVGKFAWMVDGNAVIVSKDSGNSIQTINLYTYRNNELAHDAAWRMANLQARA